MLRIEEVIERYSFDIICALKSATTNGNGCTAQGDFQTTFREYVEEGGQGIEMMGVVTEFQPNKVFAVHLEMNQTRKEFAQLKRLCEQNS